MMDDLISREAAAREMELCFRRGINPEKWSDRIRSMTTADLSSPLGAVEAERERCAVICEEQALVFGSDEYATGQPMSSFKERFACESIAAAIRTGAKQ